MFTGLVEGVGRFEALLPKERGFRLQLATERAWNDVTIGESIAVDGCCLTVIEAGAGRLTFDLLAETRRRTRFEQLEPGEALNLERSLEVGARLGGHFVTGHIDAVVTLRAVEVAGEDWRVDVDLDAAQLRYIVQKGSVALNGVSLTVAEVDARGLSVWLIPHTRAVTNLGSWKAGSRVHIEFDLLAKHVERLLASPMDARGAAQAASM